MPNSRPSTPSNRRSQKIDGETSVEVMTLNAKVSKISKFKSLIAQSNIDLDELRKLSWSGIPEDCRATVWQLLMGYLPVTLDRQKQTLARKRAEYIDLVTSLLPQPDPQIWHQIHIDVPRTNPSLPIYQVEIIQQSLEKILYCWAIRHPASGYVQGINDLVTPFFWVFLGEAVGNGSGFDMNTADLGAIPPAVYSQVEADSFWCLTKLLDGIQDNYTVGQPGIQRQIVRLQELIQRLDAPLHAHLTAQGVSYLQFSFRWMNCMLMRELPAPLITRMWDTYLAEVGDGFCDYHVFVCSAFLVRWRNELLALDFQEIMMFVQSPPTKDWTEKDIEPVLSQAYVWKSAFHNTRH